MPIQKRRLPRWAQLGVEIDLRDNQGGCVGRMTRGNSANVGRAKVDFGPATDTGVAATTETTGAAADIKCGRFEYFDKVAGDGLIRGRRDCDLLRLPAPTTSMGAARCSNKTGARRARATEQDVTTTACRTHRVKKQAVCEATLLGGDGRGAEVCRKSRRRK